MYFIVLLQNNKTTKKLVDRICKSSHNRSNSPSKVTVTIFSQRCRSVGSQLASSVKKNKNKIKVLNNILIGPRAIGILSGRGPLQVTLSSQLPDMNTLCASYLLLFLHHNKSAIVFMLSEQYTVLQNDVGTFKTLTFYTCVFPYKYNILFLSLYPEPT